MSKWKALQKPSSGKAREEEASSSKSKQVAEPSKKKQQLFEPESEEDEEEDEEVNFTHLGDDLEGSDEEDEEDSDASSASEDQEEEDEEEDEEEEEEDEGLALTSKPDEDMTPQETGERIKETSKALSDFKAYKKRTQTVASRSDLIEQLHRDCAVYYGYLPELIDLFATLFGPGELVEFLEANEVPRPTVIRTNTLKTTRKQLAKALTARGIGLEPVAEWTNLGLKIFESAIPVGATPEYLAGHYMIQSPSSFTPVMALDPQPGEKILDMCASPGGKTTHIAQLMKNTGFLVANDAKLPRIDALVGNLARLAVKIATTVNQDGRDFPKVLGGFDRILLDAPCSGLGVISHDPAVKSTRTLVDILQTANLQRELLLSAIDSVKTGGVVVYSTCSISVQENEHVVQFALDRRDVEIIACEFEIGRPGLTKYQGRALHPSLKLSKRLYPHTHNMDGFYVCKLIKKSTTVLENGKRPVVVASAAAKALDNDDAEDLLEDKKDKEKQRTKQLQITEKEQKKGMRKLLKKKGLPANLAPSPGRKGAWKKNAGGQPGGYRDKNAPDSFKKSGSKRKDVKV
ncbi:ribosomal RNA small subunit methyltransferase B [Batrachochytrium salamandrivorans]|nr:ribosomal RNA small subunit methyltransferase B [Batrachochytrium salamandrivorans]